MWLMSFRPLSHRPQHQAFVVAECACAILYETGMSVSGVYEDCNVLRASGPSLVAVWNRELC